VRYLGMVGLSLRRGQQEGLAKYTFSAEECEAQPRPCMRRATFSKALLGHLQSVEVIFCAAGTPVAEYRRRIHGFFATRAKLERQTSPLPARRPRACSL